MNTSIKYIALVLSTLIALPASAATVSLLPSTNEVVTGQQFTVDLYLDAGDVLGPNPGNILGKPKVFFDTTLVQYDSFGFEPAAVDYSLTVNSNNVIVDFTTVDYSVGVIGTFTFTALGNVGDTINLGVMDSDNFFTTFFNSKGANTPFTPQFEAGDVSVVPIPAAAWLFGSGLVGLFGWSRRRAITAHQ